VLTPLSTGFDHVKIVKLSAVCPLRLEYQEGLFKGRSWHDKPDDLRSFMAINNHYIPKWMTKPWEFKGGMLKYYDFDTGKISEASREILFAKPDIYSASLEKLLNERAENSLASQVQKLCTTDEPLPNYHAFRTSIFAILLMSARIKGSQGDLEALEQFQKFSRPSLDSLTELTKKSFELIRIKIIPPAIFFFPSTGIFGFPVRTDKGYEFGFGLPLSPFVAIALVPKNRIGNSPDDLIQRGVIAAFSTGLDPHCTKVVIPIECTASDFDLEKGIVTQRSSVASLIKFVHQRNEFYDAISLVNAKKTL
jgi:hypothetical protein